MIKQNIAQLLETEMERKDFLKFVGLGLIAATGITQILKTLNQQTGHKTPISGAANYGSSAYGGVAKK